MTWVALFSRLLAALKAFSDWVRSAKDIELGRLKEREANDRENESLRDVIRRANADSVHDDEAFGSGGQDNNLPGFGKGRPTNRPD